MKLILCPECGDVVRLMFEKRKCGCGKAYGRYYTEAKAVISADAIPLGIANSSLTSAVKNQPKEGLGSRFEAFVIPEVCDTVVYTNEPYEGVWGEQD